MNCANCFDVDRKKTIKIWSETSPDHRKHLAILEATFSLTVNMKK
jgi:hypothetical protein